MRVSDYFYKYRKENDNCWKEIRPRDRVQIAAAQPELYLTVRVANPVFRGRKAGEYHANKRTNDVMKK